MLTTNRKTHYLCQTADGTFVYISADSENFTYESFKLFVGDGVTMREIPIKEVQRLRDGGTTNFFTDEGKFFSPSPFKVRDNPLLVPTWDSKGLITLQPDDYTIVDTGGAVTISKK